MAEMIFDSCQRLGGHVCCSAGPYCQKVANIFLALRYHNYFGTLCRRQHKIQLLKLRNSVISKYLTKREEGIYCRKGAFIYTG
jgi:hypothetical protein